MTSSYLEYIHSNFTEENLNISQRNWTESGDRVANAEIEKWDIYMTVFEGVNIFLFVVALWMLLSAAVYGSKSNRWFTRPGTASLSNGLVYIVFIFIVLAFNVKIISTEFIYLASHALAKFFEGHLFGLVMCLYCYLSAHWERKQSLLALDKPSQCY